MGIKDGEVRSEGSICEPCSDISPIWKDMRSELGYTTLCAIRKPAFKRGDRKFMTLLPSFNGKETRTGTETPTGRDYLITDVKQLASLDLNFFLFRKAWALLNIRNDKIYNKRNAEV